MFTSITKTCLVIMILLTGCINKVTESPMTPEASDEQLAQQALLNFLEDLHSARFEEAVQIFGGSYEGLIDNNMDVQPDNFPQLLESACMINGYQCLEVKTVSLEKNISATEFSFLVEFLNGDGSLFVRGPCCGGSTTDFPPESSFRFTVTKDNEGDFLVMDLPPYVP